MDLLFSKYASPFALLDHVLTCGRFAEFVDQFIELENERQVYDFWLHKVFDQSYDDFKRSIEPREEVDESKIETTIIESQGILANFVPQE